MAGPEREPNPFQAPGDELAAAAALRGWLRQAAGAVGRAASRVLFTTELTPAERATVLAEGGSLPAELGLRGAVVDEPTHRLTDLPAGAIAEALGVVPSQPE